MMGGKQVLSTRLGVQQGGWRRVLLLRVGLLIVSCRKRDVGRKLGEAWFQEAISSSYLLLE